MDQVAVRAEALGKLHPEIKIAIDKAAALEQARILRAGIRAELIGSLGGGPGGGGLLGGLKGLLGLGGSAAKGGGAGGGGLSGLIGGTGPVGIGGAAGAGILAAIAAIVTGATGILPVLAAAGLGIASFGALAIPTISKVTAAVTALGKAQTAVARDKAWDILPKSLVPAVHSLISLKDAFGKLVTAMQPAVLGIFNQGLKTANLLLYPLVPFAQAAAGAIGGLLKHFDKFARSEGFNTFLAQLLRLTGPAITAIGQGIGRIGVSLGHLLVALINPNGMRALHLVFQ